MQWFLQGISRNAFRDSFRNFLKDFFRDSSRNCSKDFSRNFSKKNIQEILNILLQEFLQKFIKSLFPRYSSWNSKRRFLQVYFRISPPGIFKGVGFFREILLQEFLQQLLQSSLFELLEIHQGIPARISPNISPEITS